MKAEQPDENGGTKLPPYTSFQSVKTLLDKLKKDGLPGQIDRSVLTNFSGAVGGQVITALKFLNLISQDSRPTTHLQELVEAYDTDAWPAALAKVIRHAYQPIFKLSLETATPSQFSNHFKAAYPGQDTVLKKCMIFFLSAVRDAQIPVSTYLTKNKKPRAMPTKKRAPNKTSKKYPPPLPPADESGGVGGGYNSSSKTPAEVLLSLLSSDMKQTEQDAIWTLIKHFKTKGEKAA